MKEMTEALKGLKCKVACTKPEFQQVKASVKKNGGLSRVTGEYASKVSVVKGLLETIDVCDFGNLKLPIMTAAEVIDILSDKPSKPVHPQSIADLVHGYKEKHDKLTAEVDELHAKWRTRIMERNIANAAYKAARAAAKKIESSAL